MTADDYTALHRRVLDALVREDPMRLADPAIQLADEYDAEAREIARRMVLSDAGDEEAVTAAVIETFQRAFDKRLPADGVSAVAARIVLGDDGVAIREELYGCWFDFSGLAVRAGTVRIPMLREVPGRRGRGTPAGTPDRVLVISNAAAVEIHDPLAHPWAQEFDGLWIERGSQAFVQIDGQIDVTARVYGDGDELRVALEHCGPDGLERGDPSPAVALSGVAGGDVRRFADIDAARHALTRERSVGVHHGRDEDGYQVTITVTDVSSSLRRRARLRRWLGPALDVTSLTTDGRVGCTVR